MWTAIHVAQTMLTYLMAFLADSSKDSSLQSDTSIESEDSFASVIYIPKKPETQSNKMPSVPTSPLMMPLDEQIERYVAGAGFLLAISLTLFHH